MSNVSTQHTITVFDSATSKPLTGQRLAKVIFRAPRDGSKREHTSKCASVPFIEKSALKERLNDFLPAIVELCENVQDKIIRDAYMNGASSVSDEELSISAILAYMEAENSSSRLTKEDVEAWFAESMEPTLTVALAEKLGIDCDKASEFEVSKLEGIITIYKSSFASLAGGKTKFAKDTAAKLLKAIEVSECDDMLAIRFAKRLNAMIHSAQEDLLAL